MAPEFIAVMKGWDLAPNLPESTFQPDIPSDAIEVEFMTLERVQPMRTLTIAVCVIAVGMLMIQGPLCAQRWRSCSCGR